MRHAVFLDANGGVWATGNADASQLGALPPLTPSRVAHQVGSLRVRNLTRHASQRAWTSARHRDRCGRDCSAAVDRGG
ncbi:hypothetical protein XSP_000109 [Xanthomonas euroxanthea]|uniref:Uncharacterized protein n=1 Tax=Xanthomonas euroxanthea TaxID=2259622 RepID=A0A8E4GCS9_9XANT|nr:hypothetical protein XSP_000109 [Xanthomonas euroxanthea]